MEIKRALEGIVVGLIAQALVGWISPFTPVLSGFLSGVVTRNERDGTLTGFVLGTATAVGFVARMYFNLGLPYLYPTAAFLSKAGPLGTYVVVLVMIFAGIIGGKVGGSLMQRSAESGFQRGEIVGELRKIRKEARKAKRSRKSR